MTHVQGIRSQQFAKTVSIGILSKEFAQHVQQMCSATTIICCQIGFTTSNAVVNFVSGKAPNGQYVVEFVSHVKDHMLNVRGLNLVSLLVFNIIYIMRISIEPGRPCGDVCVGIPCHDIDL